MENNPLSDIQAIQHRERLTDLLHEWWGEVPGLTHELRRSAARSRLTEPTVTKHPQLRIRSIIHPHSAFVELLMNGSWRGGCNCHSGSTCVHIVGSALRALALVDSWCPREAPRSGSTSTFLEYTIKLGWGVRREVEVPHENPEVERLTQRLKELNGQRLTPSQKRIVSHLVNMHDLGDSGTFEYMLQALFGYFAQEAPYMDPGYMSNHFRPIAEAKTKTTEELLSLIAQALSEKGRTIPNFLKEIVDLDWAAREKKNLERRSWISSWKSRFSQMNREARPQDERKSPRQLRLKIHRSKMVWEISPGNGGQFTSIGVGEVKELLGTHVEDFRGGRLTGGKGSELFDGPSSAFLLLLRSNPENFRYRTNLQLKEESDRRLLADILRHPVASPCIVAASGRPFTQALTRLVWRISEATDGNVIMSLKAQDGSSTPTELYILSANPAVYLDIEGGQWFTGHVPPNPDEAIVQSVVLPKEALEDEEAGRFIARNVIALPAGVSSKFLPEPLTPTVHGWIEPAKGQFPEKLIFEMTAVRENGMPRLGYALSKWAEAKPVEPDSAPVDETALRPAYVHFGGFAFDNVQDSKKGPWKQFEANSDTLNPDALSKWLRSFPKGTTVLLTQELDGLVATPTRAEYHISVQSAPGNAIDWFDVKAELRSEDTTLTPTDLEILSRAQGGFVKLKQGWRRLEVKTDDAITSKFSKLGFGKDFIAESQREGGVRLHALHLADDSYRDLHTEESWRNVTARAATLVRPAEVPLPAGLTATLRPYQHAGFKFLHFISSNRLGCILADDMGLGKTIQSLAWLLWLRSTKPKAAPFKVLIVCPKSVQPNWVSETEKFAPTLTTAEMLPLYPENALAKGKNLVIANYAQLRNRAETLAKIEWDAVILDEGQNIKNPSSQTARAAYALRSQHRLVLSGTPVENRSLDLWSLFHFAMPGLLGSLAQFKRLYDDSRPETMALLRARVGPFMLRRTKDQAAPDLPERTTEELLVELTPDQRKLYDAEFKLARSMLAGVTSKTDFNKSRFNILTSITRMRQICCHPRLVAGADDSWADDETCSAKLEALLDQLEPIAEEGHKVLVFSTFLEMLTMIEKALDKRKIGHLRLDGSTQNRKELVDQFQTDPSVPVFLITLKAGGSGLNLTAASYVVIFDPWWNPAKEAQAIDRTHRIGQTRRVIAYHLIAKNTIEEKIQRLQQHKTEIAGAIVKGDDITKVMDLDSIREILS